MNSTLEEAQPADQRSDNRRSIAGILRRVEEKVAPVWPLQDYVAVNPYQGLSHLDFPAARHALRQVSQAEMLMPLSYYAHRFQSGGFDKADINVAIDQLLADGVRGVELVDVNLLVARLRRTLSAAPAEPASQRYLSVVEMIDARLGSAWSRRVTDEVGKYCSDHYDRGQSAWASPNRKESLYAAWQACAVHDRTLDVLGIKGFRELVSRLPAEPAQAVAILCEQIGVPAEHWEQQLWCEALALPGWSAWARYQTRSAEQQSQTREDFAGLLAMRLAYSLAIARHLNLPLAFGEAATDEAIDTEVNDELLRYVLLTASEAAFRRRLVSLLQQQMPVAADCQTPGSGEQGDLRRPTAQLVFCIDVRSERFRRNLEAQSERLETFGFAGFFGMPIEYVPFGEQAGSPRVPVLIQPKFQVFEGVSTEHAQALTRHASSKAWSRAWRSFSTSAVSTFAFVETTGILYGFKMLRQFLASVAPRTTSATHESPFSPCLAGLEEQAVGLQQQLDLAEGALRGIGLVEQYARLVVLCGHGSQTENNPLQAGLDCGACGGHTGEANARFAAMLLNQAEVREGLAQRGLVVPSDVHFVAALHNTTTDSITFYDTERVPKSHRGDLEQLRAECGRAGEQTRLERLALLPGGGTQDLNRRSRDWSEVRPEWGLAGNAAFIAAPRSLTRSITLNARSFLHSYDYRQDSGGAILEQIMTAPLVVAHWINMQYYASTVDPTRLGSGTKTVHNVVGQIGVFSGNGGDLMTGLPWQSIHDGEEYQHHPLRLLGIIAAPRAAIERVIAAHDMLGHLLTNDWLHLVAIEDNCAYRYTRKRTWDIA